MLTPMCVGIIEKMVLMCSRIIGAIKTARFMIITAQRAMSIHTQAKRGLKTLMAIDRGEMRKSFLRLSLR